MRRVPASPRTASSAPTGCATTGAPVLQPRLVEHIELTLIAVGIGFVISLAAALLAHRLRLDAAVRVRLGGDLHDPEPGALPAPRPVDRPHVTTVEIALVGYTLADPLPEHPRRPALGAARGAGGGARHGADVDPDALACRAAARAAGDRRRPPHRGRLHDRARDRRRIRRLAGSRRTDPAARCATTSRPRSRRRRPRVGLASSPTGSSSSCSARSHRGRPRGGRRDPRRSRRFRRRAPVHGRPASTCCSRRRWEHLAPVGRGTRGLDRDGGPPRRPARPPTTAARSSRSTWRTSAARYRRLVVIAVGFTFLGLGFTNVMVALVVLAVPPILTNAYVAVDEVDPDAVEAARGMGMTPYPGAAARRVPSRCRCSSAASAPLRLRRRDRDDRRHRRRRRPRASPGEPGELPSPRTGGRGDLRLPARARRRRRGSAVQRGLTPAGLKKEIPAFEPDVRPVV